MSDSEDRVDDEDEEGDEEDSDYGYLNIRCPFCHKSNYSNEDRTCEHYFLTEFYGHEYFWGGSDDSYNEIIQLNRTINRPKTNEEIFAKILSEVPSKLKPLLEKIRHEGFSFWLKQPGIKSVYTEYTEGFSTVFRRDYFSNGSSDLGPGLTQGVEPALIWFEKFHPELLVKRQNIEEYGLDGPFYTDEYPEGYQVYEGMQDDYWNELNEPD